MLTPMARLTTLTAAIALMLFGHLYLTNIQHSLLFIIGVLMGVTLFKGMFGFAGAYAKAFEQRQMNGILSQILMLALATLLFSPILTSGYVFDHDVIAASAPLSVALAIGAFMFGVGMQLAGSCASGSLFVAASGDRRTLLVLLFFCLGAFIGSLHLHYWSALPQTPAIVLNQEYGVERALPLQLAVLAILYFIFSQWQNPSPTSEQKPLWWRNGFSWRALIIAPWPLMLSATLLALLNWLTLLVAGHPWSITWAFSLWGAKLATWFAWDPTSSVFWSKEFQSNALAQPILADETSVMNIGIFLGATFIASAVKKFSITGDLSKKSIFSAIIAGLLMGYGARLASGCNIGAFFSGISSTSLHGWLWIVCAIPGCWLGLQLNKQLNK